MTRTICFDLEGPLSPQDNAYEVMKLIGPAGARIFEAISRYDDLLALEGRSDYEPGDTLALIVPFFLLHGITEADIQAVSARAKIVEGAAYLFDQLRAEGWEIFIISTSYEQHAFNIGQQLTVPRDHIICTRLTLRERKRQLPEAFFRLIRATEAALLDLSAVLEHDETARLKELLDTLFFQQLPALGYEIFATRVIGGERKAEAVRRIARERGVAIRDIIAVGDSITDFKMLREVAAHNGIAVVFNGNEYAVPYANVGLASVDIRFLYLICRAFERGGKEAALALVTGWEENRDAFEAEPGRIPDKFITPDLRDFLTAQRGVKAVPYFHYLERADEPAREKILRIHKRFRMLVREDAGKLG
jgi:energy-converting hydrogenase A subunit R